MKTTISILLCLAALAAGAVDVTVMPRDFTSGTPAHRNVTVTLTGPSGQAVSGPWVIAGDAVTLNTGTNGSVTFSNMLALGEYRLDISGNPPRSFPFSLSVTSGVFNVTQLIGTNNSVQMFYDSGQVDALLAQAGLNSSNYVNQSVTNAVKGQLAVSNNYNGTFTGFVAGGATTATNGAISGFFSTSVTNSGNIQTATLDASGQVSAGSFAGNLTGNVVGNLTGNVAGSATIATNGAVSGFFSTSVTNSGAMSTASLFVSGNSVGGSFYGDMVGGTNYLLNTNTVAGGYWTNLYGYWTGATWTNVLKRRGFADGIGLAWTNSQGTDQDKEFLWYADGSSLQFPQGFTAGSVTSPISFIYNGLEVYAGPLTLYTISGARIDFTLQGSTIAEVGGGLAFTSTNAGATSIVFQNGKIYGNGLGLSNVIATATSTPLAGVATNAITATNGPISGFFSTSITNSANIQTVTFNATGQATAWGFFGPLIGAAQSATNSQTAGVATNGAASGFFAAGQTNTANLQAPSITVPTLVGSGAAFTNGVTNLTVILSGAVASPGTTAFQVNYASGSQGILFNTNGQLQVNDTSGNAIIAYSGAPAAADSLTLGRDEGTILLADPTGTYLWDHQNHRRVNVSTNAVSVNTNLFVGGSVVVTNHLSVNGTITNLGLSVNAVVYSDANRSLQTIANGGANTVLLGSTPPAFGAVPDGALSANVFLLNAANTVSGVNTHTVWQKFLGAGFGGIVVTNAQTNLYATASTMALFDAQQRLVSLGNGGANTVLHGTSTPAYSAVVEGDLSLSDVTTANASTSAHGFMPKGDANANHFFNGANALTSIPDGALSGNVPLKNGANAMTGANQFSGLTTMDNLTVTNGLTNQSLTANALVYADGNKRLQSITPGGASQYLKSGSPAAFATINGATDISGTVPLAGLATAAQGLASGAPGTNNVLWTDQYQTNAIFVTGKFITESNSNGGTITMFGGNQTNSGSLWVGAGQEVAAADGHLILNGNLTLNGGISATVGPNTFNNNSGGAVGLEIVGNVSQTGTASYSLLTVVGNISSEGSGSRDLAEFLNGSTMEMNLDRSGNQTNNGVIKASAFYGALHGVADTCLYSSTATNAVLATNLVAAASLTNIVVQINGTAGGRGSWAATYPNGNTAFQQDTNGSITVNDLNGNPVLSYSGAPYASEVLTLGKDNGNVVYSDRTTTRLYGGDASIKLSATASAVTIATNTSVTGSLNYWRPVLAKTANYSVLQSDSGSSINNNGAVGATTNSLPASWVGGNYRFTVVASQTVGVKASGSDTIADPARVTAGGGLIFSSTPRATIDLECQVAGQWIVVGGSTNTWTFQ